MSVLVVVEHDRGAMADASLEAFAFARSIADQLGEHVEALLIGATAADLADVCAAHGATACHLVPAADDYGPELYGAVVLAAAGQLSPSGIVACGTGLLPVSCLRAELWRAARTVATRCWHMRRQSWVCRSWRIALR